MAQHNMALGLEQIRIRFTEFDISTPIDVSTALNGLGGEPSIFYSMLGQLEDMTLKSHLKKVIPEFEK